ncbi:MAG: hypothetical protein AAF927_31870 [Bacteroidota bacterium]
MQRLFQRLTPNWLQRLDRHLLLNDPILWATRIHHVFFWGVLGLLLAGFYGYYVPVGERHALFWAGGTFLMGLLAMGGLILWWTRLLNFPATQQAGRLKGWLSIRNLIVFLLGTGLLSAIPVLYYELIAQRWYELRLSFAPLGMGGSTTEMLAENHIWPVWLLAVLPVFWLLSDMANYMRKREFWLTIGMALALGSLLTFIIDAIGPGKDTALPLFIVIFLVAQVRFLVEWVFEDNPAQERSVVAQIIFLGLSSLHIWLIPTAILTAVEYNIYIENPELVIGWQVVSWLIGAAFSLFMWHRCFRPKVLDLYLQPPE